MRRFCLGRLFACGLCLVGLSSPSADEAAPAPSPGDLVRQLGDEVFAVRKRAEATLRAVGLPAREALRAGLKDDDPEVRRACRRVLATVLELDLQQRLKRFVEDQDGKSEHDLPGWQRFRLVAGEDREARELFAKMLQADAPLLESIETGALEAIRVRSIETNQMLFGPDPARRQKVSGEAVAALLFACSQAPPGWANDSQDVLARLNFIPMLGQGDFGAMLQNGPHKRCALALLGAWLRLPASQPMIMQKLRLGLTHGLKEASLGLACALLDKPQQHTPTDVAAAVEAVARLGGKPYAATLSALLDDQRMCTQRVVNEKPQEIQVRDVTLAWLLNITGQDPVPYGLQEAAQWFNAVKQAPGNAFNFANFYFAAPAARDAALKKWAEWSQANALPESPPTPRTEVVRVPAGAGGAVAPARVGRTERGLPLAERQQIGQLKRAGKLIQDHDFAAAAALLGEILAADSDYYFQPDSGAPVYQHLKAQAEQLLASLPAAGFAAYELHYGPQARAELERGLATPDLPALIRVERNYFFTEAGAEAAFLLGSYNRLDGHLIQAAQYLERLRRLSPLADHFEPSLSLQLAVCWLRVDLRDKARDCLLRLRQREGDRPVWVGGQAHAWFASDDQALGWLEGWVGTPPAAKLRWALHRGDRTGNPPLGDGLPYLQAPLWSPVLTDPALAELTRKIQRTLAENRRTLLPTLQPLVVDGIIVQRTATALCGVDLATGAIRWESPADNALWHLLQFADPEEKQRQEAPLTEALRRRLWEDPGFGTLSSNGRLAFAVEDLGVRLAPSFRRSVVLPDGRRQIDLAAFAAYNRLAAYDLHSGKVKWELGGPKEAADEPLAGGRFLGPPLPLGDELYAVVEFPEQSLLVAIDAARGLPHQQWVLDAPGAAASSAPENPQPALEEAGPTRGVSPVYADGLVVCRGSQNRYVAVELLSRAVRWAFSPPPPPTNVGNLVFGIPQRKQLAQLRADVADRWSDGGATIADGRVLLTPLDSDELYCLNLADGALAWTAFRRDGVYVAGVRRGRVLLVGRGHVWALNLADGKPAWNHGDVALPPGATPSGVGYLGEHRLYVPLASAEVVAIDIDQGRLAARSQSPDGSIPGNLVPVGDALVSLSPDGLRRFDTLEVRTRQLAARPGDQEQPATLVDRGELLLYDGHVEEAFELLRRAQSQQPSPRGALLLGQALLQTVSADRPQFGPLAEEVDRILPDSASRSRYLEQLAARYQQAGKLREAWDAYMRLLDAKADPRRMVDVSPGQSVRRDRYIQGCLAALLAAADAPTRAEFERQLTERLGDTKGLEQLAYLACFPAAANVRLRLARDHAGQGHPLQAELLLRPLLSHPAPELRAGATAQLAELLRANGRALEAARCYTRLAGPLAETPCLAGQTGRQIVDALPADDPARRWLSGADPWPTADPEKQVGKTDPQKANSFLQLSPLPVQSDGTLLAPRLALEVDPGQRKLYGYDGQGALQLELTFPQEANNNHMFWFQNYFMNSGRCTGHLLLLWSGRRVLAIDQLAEGGKGKIIWTRDTLRADPNNWWMLPMMRARMQLQGQPGQPGLATVAQPLVATPGYVAFQQERLLFAVEPASGETLWLRDDLPRGCDLLGDDQVLLATPPDAEEAIVLSPLDGRELGRKPVPAVSQRLLICGRSVVTSGTSGETVTLKGFDPWEQTLTWSRQFPAKAKCWPTGGCEISVLSPDGKFVVLSATDGRPVIETTVAAVADLESIFVLQNERRYVLIANQSESQKDDPFQSNRPQPGYARAHGQVWGIDARTGRNLWSAEVRQQWVKINHPVDAPLLTFFRRHQTVVQLGNNSWRHEQPVITLRCLDSRSGKTLHEAKFEKSFEQSYRLQVDPATNRIEVRTRLETAAFTYRAPPSAAK